MSYTASQTEPLAQRLVANLPGLDINLARAWITAESGAHNNPLGVTAQAGSGQPVGQWISPTTYLVKYATPQAGIDAASSLLKSSSMTWAYGKVLTAIKGGSPTAQAQALIASPWNTRGSPYYTRVFTSAGLLNGSLPQTSTVAPKPATTPVATAAPVPGGLTLQQWIANVKKRYPNSSASSILKTATNNFNAQQSNYKPNDTATPTPQGGSGPGYITAQGTGTAISETISTTTDAVKGTVSWLLGYGKGSPGFLGNSSGATPLTQSMIDTITGDIPVDNPNRAAIISGLQSQIGKPVNTVKVPSNWTDTPSGGWQNFWGGQAGANGSGGGLGNSGIGAGQWWTNPTFILYVVGGLLLIVAGGFIMIRNTGATKTIVATTAKAAEVG